MYLKSSFIVAGCLLCLAGCAGGSTKDGAVDGGLFGKSPDKLVSSSTSAVLGAISGNRVGKDLDDKDRLLSAEAVMAALETNEAGVPQDWRNALNGHSGQIIPGPPYTVNDYRCRDYTQRLVIGDRTDTIRTTACRQPDGTWRALI